MPQLFDLAKNERAILEELSRASERALAVLRFVYPVVPERLRHVGPYQEARSRLAGRRRPGAATQLLNRLWIGQKAMAE